MTAVRAADGRAEGLVEPLGLGVASPRLSWRIESAAAGIEQVAYQLQQSKIGDDFAAADETCWIEDANSLDRGWPFPPLASRQRCWWRVRVRTTAGTSDWSQPWSVEAGLLDTSDWRALFVGAAWEEDVSESQPCPLLRREFRIDADVSSARLYVTAFGCYEIEINGTRVGDERLSPGWTTYSKRLLYRTHDVTGLLVHGDNVVAATLADGWYRGYLGWKGERNHYGTRLGLLAQVEVKGSKGETLVVATDDEWLASTGTIRSADLYRGETADAAYTQPGWSEIGFDADGWTPATVVAGDLSAVTAACPPPVRVVGEVLPRSVERRPDGSLLVDFGQNLVGHLRFMVPGKGRRRVVARHAEILNADGTLRTDLLRSAAATDTLITSEEGGDLFEPRFTFHGFRFAEIAGVPELEESEIAAVVLSASLDDIGEFSCSVADLEQLHSNTRWSLRGNFVSVPTDCPQRDERLGWTGDAQVFAPTAAFLVDTRSFLTSWLADVVVEQRTDGAIPWVVPNVLGADAAGAAGWGDVIACMPYDLYVAYADPAPIELAFDAMRRWVDFELSRAGEDLVWSGDFQFGDWLDPDAPAGLPWDAKASADLVSSAYLCRSLGTVSLSAAVIGRDREAGHYAALADRARRAWWGRFATEATASQTGVAMALQFRLAPPEECEALGSRLRDLVDQADGHLTTGFLGTPLLCSALAGAGHEEDAYRVLLQRTPPSWLYPITKGATTIWERWDALRPDGSVPIDPLASSNHSMVSFNHYAYGAVCEFLHRTVAGLAPDPERPGYKRVLVEPKPGGGITCARARHVSRYGPVQVSWTNDDGLFDLDVELPPATSAIVRLPQSGEEFEVTSGHHNFKLR